MVQVRTVHESSQWRNKVDGLQQGVAYADRSCAVAAGRQIAVELGGSHDVLDLDGRVVEHAEYESRPSTLPPALRYTA